MCTGSRFGAMLDMLTDRCATACLIVNLALLYPSATPLFQFSLSLDVASHWLHLHSSVLKGSESHKNLGGKASRLLGLYYKSRVRFPHLSANTSFSPVQKRVPGLPLCVLSFTLPVSKARFPHVVCLGGEGFPECSTKAVCTFAIVWIVCAPFMHPKTSNINRCSTRITCVHHAIELPTDFHVSESILHHTVVDGEEGERCEKCSGGEVTFRSPCRISKFGIELHIVNVSDFNFELTRKNIK
uniref:CDP-diacylglycerol--inositol 3-phosphatidyltransferase n=1 Tax=Eptatretus burgeri TaxID=7764 RepID=A0A8C4QFG0_EPTBU